MILVIGHVGFPMQPFNRIVSIGIVTTIHDLCLFGRRFGSIKHQPMPTLLTATLKSGLGEVLHELTISFIRKGVTMSFRRKLEQAFRVVQAYLVLSDQARNDRASARRALQSDLVEHLGVHLFLWLYFPNAQEWEHWRAEAETALSNLVERLMKSQHKKQTLLIDALWFDADDVQDALNGITATCQSRALRKMKGTPSADIPNENTFDTFEDFGFKVHNQRTSNGLGLSISYQGKPLIKS
jgi:hypothetical protein